MDVDLNIDNYTKDDLINFFQLNNDYTREDLESKEKEISLSIVSSNKKSYTPEYKINVLEFVKQAKKVLLNNNSGRLPDSDYQMQVDSNYTSNPLSSNSSLLSSSSSIEPFNPMQKNKIEPSSSTAIINDDTQKGLDYHINSKGQFILTRTLGNNVGKVINPMSQHPVIQTNNIIPNAINSYGVSTVIKNYLFNTRYRTDYFTTKSSDCGFILPTKLKNVTSITLSALQYPNVSFAFDQTLGTNSLVIEEFEDGNINQAIVYIPSGNYSITSFQSVLEEAINFNVLGIPADLSSNYRFKVSNDPYTHFTTISNTTYNFNMYIVTKLSPIPNIDQEFLGFGNCGDNYYLNPNIYNDKTDLKGNVLPSDIYTSMGYLLGYRNPVYTGSKSYTSESQFNPVLSNYVYFCLDDYNKNNFTTTYGILPNSMIDENILAVVAITSPTFASTFDSGANFIYKTRHYTSPVDITRIHIKMLNTFGAVVNLFENDYVFCLEVETLYDALKPPTQTEIRVTQ